VPFAWETLNIQEYARPDDRYGIGVKFRDRLVTWSAMRRYDGIQISSLAKSKPS